MASIDPGTAPSRDEHRDLVSVLYHALQWEERIERYIQDADDAGDATLGRFFREIREENAARAERARALLRERLDREHVEDAVDEASMESFPASDPPGTY